MISEEMVQLRRMRRLCDISQADVYAGTGIPANRLSKAENGLLELTRPELSTLKNFLAGQWTVRQEHDARMFNAGAVSA